jgi:polar amino acid transport system substrate-binding protein
MRRQRFSTFEPMARYRINVWIAALLACLTASLPSQAAAQSASSRDLKTIVESGVLRVALTRFNLPAFHWRSEGAIVGPEAELAKQIARALGINVEFLDRAPSFDGVVDEVALGRAEIGISKLSQTYYRLARVRFSEPYITLRHALLFERAAVGKSSGSRPPEEALRQFSGRIGVIRGSAYVDFGRRNFPTAQVVEMANWNTAIEELVARRVNALYRDEFEIRRVLRTRPTLNVHFGAAIITDQNAYLSVAICDSCSKLQEFINYHITQTKGTFTLKGLLASDLSQ